MNRSPSDRPNREEIRRRALRAAAAVAVSAGCSSPTIAITAPGTDGNAGGSDSQMADLAAGSDSTGHDGGSSDTADTVASDAKANDTLANDTLASDSGDSAADAAMDSSTATDTADGPPDCKHLTDGAQIGECCNARSAWCLAAYPADSQKQNECHFGPDFDGTTGCIPWGPPAPPAWEFA